MNEPKLKPCPFCGCNCLAIREIEPHSHEIATFMPDYPGSFSIECPCGIGIIDGSRELLIKRWNTRTPSLRWTKTPPTEKDIGNMFAAKYEVDGNSIMIAGRIALQKYPKDKDGFLVFVPISVLAPLEMNWLIEHNAEFFGPLPE